MKTLRDELRAKYPERAARASKSAKSAIRLFCIECCGGEAGEARRCQVRNCFLWPHVKAWRAPQLEGSLSMAAAEEDVIELEDVLEQEDDPIEDDTVEDDSTVASADASATSDVVPPKPARRPPPPRAKAAKEQGPPLDRTPGALVGKTLRHVEQDGSVRECVVTERGFEYGGQVYTSISAAAKAASGRKAANGWEYWALRP